MLGLKGSTDVSEYTHNSAQLFNYKISDSGLISANLYHANQTGRKLGKVNFQGAVFCEAILPSGYGYKY
jgi:uncharacterized protein YjbI with pentapeptide repeats